MTWVAPFILSCIAFASSMFALFAGDWKLTKNASDKSLRGNNLTIGMWLWVKTHPHIVSLLDTQERLCG